MKCPKCGGTEFILGHEICSETQPEEDITVYFECDDCETQVPVSYTPVESK